MLGNRLSLIYLGSSMAERRFPKPKTGDRYLALVIDKGRRMVNISGNTVSISKSEYDELMRRDWFLGALEAVGVDSWEGYEEAQKEMPYTKQISGTQVS